MRNIGPYLVKYWFVTQARSDQHNNRSELSIGAGVWRRFSDGAWSAVNGSPRRIIVASLLAAACTGSLWAAAAFWYVGSEKLVYFWDQLMWWKWSVKLMGDAMSAPLAAAQSFQRSLVESEYPLLPAVPLAAWCAAFGASRLSFVLGITSIYGTAAAATLTILCLRQAPPPSSATPLSLPTAFLPAAIWTLWSLPFVVSMRGFVEVGGVALAYGILGLFFSIQPGRVAVGRWLAIGGLLAGLFLFRRIWAYWITSFGMFLALDAAWQVWQARHMSVRERAMRAVPPFIIGGAAFVTAALVAWPTVVRVLTTSYSDMYSGYQVYAEGGGLAEVLRVARDLLATNGVIETLLGLIGLAGLIAAGSMRRLGVCLVTTSVLSYLHFRGVQSPGLHHHLLWTSMLTAATAAYSQVLVNRLPPRLATAVMIGLLVLGGVQWVAAVVPGAEPLRGLVLGSRAQLPIVRHDLPELDRLVQGIDHTVASLGGRPKIYCLSSSPVLNQGVLYAYSPSRRRPFRSGLLLVHTADVDKRDGFPRDLVSADIVVVADPPQLHLSSRDQQVVIEPVKQILSGQGFGEPFERVDAEFLLEGSVKVYLYVRRRPIEKKHIIALSQSLEPHYPDSPFVYSYDAPK